MESNGFGSFIQRIIVRINEPFIDKMEKELRKPPFRQGFLNDSSKAYADFEWNPRTTRTGDDETVVYEFCLYFDIPHGEFSILWDESEY